MNTNVVDAQYRAMGLEFPGEAETLAQWVEQLATVPLICQPGSQWNYSVATDVLGRLVEVWSGQELADFFRDRIFTPLGMTGYWFCGCSRPAAAICRVVRTSEWWRYEFGGQ